MDNSAQPPTILSLCSGYSGLEKGLERAIGKCTVLAYVEIEAFAIANLVNKMETGQMDSVPIWTDIKTFDAKPFRNCVDILTGGYPCQPFSAAGKGKGEKDPRYLWPYIRKSIVGCRPTWVFFENVERHLNIGISKVLSDLERLGYAIEVGIFSAAEVGAPHQRKRVFILGNSQGNNKRRFPVPSMHREWIKTRGPGCNVANYNRCGINPGGKQTGWKEGPTTDQCSQEKLAGAGGYNKWPARPGEDQYQWEEPRVLADSGGEKRQGIPQPAGRIENRKTGNTSREGEVESGLG